jgi:hypothetical protein
MPTVKEGDCFSSISASEGLPDYHYLYEHAVNQALQQSRPNPNCLVAGDEVKIPPADPKTVERPAGARHKFVLKADKPLKLRLAVVDPGGQPLAGKDFELSGDLALKGQCASGGLIELVVAPAAATAKLSVSLVPPPAAGAAPTATPAVAPAAAAAPAAAPGAAPAPTPSPPPYPPKINPADFKDVEPAPATPPDRVIEWTLKLGALPSPNVLTGVQARLANLGFKCDVGSPDDVTQAGVKAFQRGLQKSETGAFADIQDDLKKAHDDP